jgi:hypothetical protein
MNSLTAGGGGAIATVAAVLITHWLRQRGGRKRSDQIRDEIYLRLNAIDFRLNEVEKGLKLRISDAALDSIAAINQIRTDLQGTIVRRESPDRSKKEVFALVTVASTAKILAAPPQHISSSDYPAVQKGTTTTG